MTNHLDRILDAATIDEVCAELQRVLDSCQKAGYVNQLPEDYQDIGARSPSEVQDWYEYLKEDERAREEGALGKIRGFFFAASRELRGFGFHRTD